MSIYLSIMTKEGLHSTHFILLWLHKTIENLLSWKVEGGSKPEPPHQLGNATGQHNSSIACAVWNRKGYYEFFILYLHCFQYLNIQLHSAQWAICMIVFERCPRACSIFTFSILFFKAQAHSTDLLLMFSLYYLYKYNTQMPDRAHLSQTRFLYVIFDVIGRQATTISRLTTLQ